MYLFVQKRLEIEFASLYVQGIALNDRPFAQWFVMQSQCHDLDRLAYQHVHIKDACSRKSLSPSLLLNVDFYLLFFGRWKSLVINLRLNLHQVYPFVLKIDVHKQKETRHNVVVLLHRLYRMRVKIYLNPITLS